MIIFKIIAAKELTTAKFLAKNNKRSTCILALNAFVYKSYYHCLAISYK